MAAELYLFDAELRDGHGFEILGARGEIRAEFSDRAELAVLRRTVLGEARIVAIPFERVSLRVWSESLPPAKLTRRRHRLTLLGASEATDDGRSRELILGFRHLGEAELRGQIDGILPRWAAIFVDELLREYQLRRPLDGAEVEAELRRLEAISGRGLLPAEQLELLRAEVGHMTTPARAPGGAPEAPPPAAAADPSSADRIDRLKTLADLLASGALTREEFEAEKARLLRS